MRALATYIEYLLVTRHYCYVPGHGAYMLAEESASLAEVFTAPHRIVRFSTLHHHDDGLLAQLLMEAEGMNYDEACRYIERQVPFLPANFAQEAARHTDIDNFGLNDIEVSTWMEIEQRKAAAAAVITPQPLPAQKEKEEVETIAIPKYWIRRAAVVALIILCFFANFLGLNDRVPEQNLAAVLDTSMLQRGTTTYVCSEEEEYYDEDGCMTEAEDAEVSDETVDYSLAEADGIDSDYNDEANETAVAEQSNTACNEETLTTQPQEKAETPDPKKWNESLPIRSMDSELAMAQSPTGRLYYIIVASCATEVDAQRALGNLRKAGYGEVGVLERDGRYRLYVNFFAIKAEAESYLTRVRSIERFHDAWLLPVRDGSLSHIIKNTYNDNQLSMELSHLNQRTERDQG